MMYDNMITTEQSYKLSGISWIAPGRLYDMVTTLTAAQVQLLM